MYLAHRTEDGREQPLLAHLEGTAKLASAFAILSFLIPHGKFWKKRTAGHAMRLDVEKVKRASAQPEF